RVADRPIAPTLAGVARLQPFLPELARTNLQNPLTWAAALRVRFVTQTTGFLNQAKLRNGYESRNFWSRGLLNSPLPFQPAKLYAEFVLFQLHRSQLTFRRADGLPQLVPLADQFPHKFKNCSSIFHQDSSGRSRVPNGFDGDSHVAVLVHFFFH